ncbi:ATP-dependent NAD(P)HX dehydratase [Haematococcus lacustris]|uniref:ATP-dependent NAD(P)HX dehydratase n=1 Tax=Haematococcus lacustris TaxID=44745 RepID=A0A699ZMP1_HAELA|nr:ATP-dependent NAD(P)HX dehydratase [Haematococcus lacustris]
MAHGTFRQRDLVGPDFLNYKGVSTGTSLRHNPVQHFRPPHIAASVSAGVVRAMQSAGPDSTQAHGLLEMFKRAVPKLDGSNYKGQHGKVGVVGGSNTYTGAPFFAAMAAHKVGADMTFTLTHPAAVPTIRGYSPDMMVSSMLPWSPMQEGSFDMEKWLKRLTVVVVGPGLDISSDPEMLLATEHLLKWVMGRGG